MVKSKRYYAQRVIEQLQNDYPNQDMNFDERDVFPVIDDIVNSFAEKDYFDSAKMYAPEVNEQYIFDWPEIEVVDGDDEVPSYFILPSNYAALPGNRGIDEIYPLQFQQRGNDHSVVIMTHSDYRRYKNLYAGSLEGRLGGYPKGNKFVFTTCGVKKKYGNMGVRLVGKSSSDLDVDEPYPIPTNREGQVIAAAMQFFAIKRQSPTDEVRDNKDES